jgi:hypothetical protein
MNWTKQLPNIPGNYLRNNYPSIRLCIYQVFFIDNELYTIHANKPIILNKLKNRFLWYGPIPKLDHE